MNLSVTTTTETNAPVDPWHWDSVAYTGVILLNDFNDFDGGELECMRMEKRKALKELGRAFLALDALTNPGVHSASSLYLQVAKKIVKGVHTDVINYEKPGRMILAQGGAILLSFLFHKSSPLPCIPRH